MNSFDEGFKECEAAHLNPLLENVDEAIRLFKMDCPETALTLLEHAFKIADFRGGYTHE